MFSLGYIKKLPSWFNRIFWKTLSYRKKKKFINDIWNPFLLDLNSNMDNIYSKQVLNPPPEIIIENSIEKARFSKKKITLPLNKKDIDEKIISKETFEQVFQSLHRIRTKKFRNHLPKEIKKSLDYVVETDIGWKLSQSDLNVHFDDEEIYELTEDDDTIQLIEDIHFAQQLIPILQVIVQEYSEKKPNSRIRDQTRNIFEQKYKEIRNQNRGILIEFNNVRMNFLQKGLRGLISPVKQNIPEKCPDWHIFFWLKGSILATAEIKNFYFGSFDQLWKKFNRDILRIEGKSVQESYEIHEAWAKGIGAKSRTRSRSWKKGGPLDMIVIKIAKFRKISYPISEDKVNELIGRSLHQFALITQKQVRSLLQNS